MTQALLPQSLLALAVLFVGTAGRAAGFLFLDESVGGRSKAMGEARVAQGRGGAALFGYPSALGDIASKSLFLSHSQTEFEDGGRSNVGYVWPLGKRGKALGVGATYVPHGQFDGRDDLGNEAGGFDAWEGAVQMAYGMKINPRFTVGVGAKWVSSVIGEVSAQGVAFDASLAYWFLRSARLTAGVMNAGPSLSYVEEKVSLPTTAALALTAKPMRRLLIMAEGRYRFDDQVTAGSLGGEAGLGRGFYLRAGYSWNPDRDGLYDSVNDAWLGATVGLGLRLGKSLTLDYAFVPLSEETQTHHASLDWRFK